ncbi:MAG: cytochrome C assembly family protein [Terriglobales bacterium]
MPILWLRVALGFYAFGLLFAVLALIRQSALSRLALPAMSVGMVFQFVSLAETLIPVGPLALASMHSAESLLSLLVMTAFMTVYFVYRTTSPGIVIFPLVFVLTFAAATHQQPFRFTSPVLGGWLIAHIALIFAGYAALFLSFTASLLYLVQERRLKSKKPGRVMSRLPPLQQIDEIGYRSLLFGFPFMTFGLVSGMVVAQGRFGHLDFLDPKILLSILMWTVYMVMLYTRWNAGWRGRRAAYLATGAFAAALIAWSANYYSAIHKVVRS